MSDFLFLISRDEENFNTASDTLYFSGRANRHLIFSLINNKTERFKILTNTCPDCRHILSYAPVKYDGIDSTHGKCISSFIINRNFVRWATSVHLESVRCAWVIDSVVAV